MTSLNRENMTSGVHWFKHPIENMKIRVKLKPTTLVTSLPKSLYNPDDPGIIHQSKMIEEYIFKWQGKRWDIYGTGKKPDANSSWWMKPETIYCEVLKEGTAPTSKLFVCNHDDKHMVLPDSCVKKFAEQVANYDSETGQSKLNDPIRSLVGRKPSESQQRLFASEEHINLLSDKYVTMHILFDNSEYFEDPPKLNSRKRTCLACLCYSKKHKYLMVTPQINDLELDPYEVETVEGEHWGYQYSIDIDFDDCAADGLTIMLRKLQRRWNRRNQNIIYFAGPPIEMKAIYVKFEILKMEGFDLNNLYVEYNLKLPDELIYDDIISGRSHRSAMYKVNGQNTYNVGYAFELDMTCLESIDPPPIQVILEVQASDYAENFRTEGFGSILIPLTEGEVDYTLTAMVPEDLDRNEGMSRRYWVGGCHLIRDSVLLYENPHAMDANYTHAEAGKVYVRWNIFTQTRPGLRIEPMPAAGTAMSAVFQDADIALMRYRLAKAKLLAATRRDEEEQETRDEEESNV